MAKSTQMSAIIVFIDSSQQLTHNVLYRIKKIEEHDAEINRYFTELKSILQSFKFKRFEPVESFPFKVFPVIRMRNFN